MWELWTLREPFEGINYHALLHMISTSEHGVRPVMPGGFITAASECQMLHINVLSTLIVIEFGRSHYKLTCLQSCCDHLCSAKPMCCALLCAAHRFV